MANQTFTKEQIEKLIKENPKFAEELAKAQQEKEDLIGSDPASDTKVYREFKQAVSELGLLKISNDEPTAPIATRDNRKLSSGVIEDKRFMQTECKKSKIVIKFDPELTENVEIGKIKNEFRTWKIENNEETEIVRINIVRKRGESLETITHLERDDFESIGKSHYVSTIELTNIDPGITEGSLVAAFDIDKVENTIRVGICTNDINYVGDDDIALYYFIPLFVKKSLFTNIEEMVNKSFEDNKLSIISKFIPEEISESDKDKLASFIEKQLYGNPYVNKNAVVAAFNDNKISSVKSPIEENSKELDELNILGYLFPRFGQENVNIDPYEKDDFGIPVLSKKDIANIKVLGISPSVVEDMVSTSKETVSSALDSIKVAKTDLEELKSEIYDAKCKLSVDVTSTDTLKETVVVLAKEANLNKTISTSEEFIAATKMQIGGFKSLSDRIQTKIDRGEFSNAYLLSCVSIFWKTIEKFGITEKHTILPALYRLINYYYLEGSDRSEMIERKNSVFQNTIANRIGVKDKSGNELRTVESILDTYSTSLIDMSTIPSDLDPEKESDELLLRATARYEFIRALASAPIQIVGRLYPEINAAIYGKEKPSDNDLEIAKKFREKTGFENIDSEEYTTLVKHIVETIKKARDVKVEDLNTVAVSAMKNANEFAKRLSSKNIKGRNKKMGMYMRSVVLLDNAKYLDPIASGYAMLTNNEAASDNEVVVKNVDESIADITVEEYQKLSDEEKQNWALFRKVSDEKKISIWMDFILRNSFNSSFCTILYKLFKDYNSVIGDNVNVDGDKMFTSSLSLIVPSLQLIETLDLSSIAGAESFDPMAYIDGDKKVKLGTSAIKNSIEGVNSIEDLKAARAYYVLECLKFVETSVNS